MRERIFSGLLRNISAGTRLALFLPVRWLQFRASPGEFALLAGFNSWSGGFRARSSPAAMSSTQWP